MIENQTAKFHKLNKEREAGRAERAAEYAQRLAEGRFGALYVTKQKNVASHLTEN